MKIWKISHGLSFFSNQTNALLKSKNLVSLHPETAAKGTSSVSQGRAFLEAEKFDLFYLCHSNERVDVIGMFIDNRPLFSIVKGHEDWVDRQYVLVKQATNLTAYDKDFDRWWSPRNNSTFSEINHQQINEFEDKIIQPSFNCSFKDILKIRKQEISKLQIKFTDLQYWKKEFVQLFDTNKDFLFERLNSLPQIELRKLNYQLSLRQNIESQPVVHLRKSILEALIEGKNVNYQFIENLKQGIGKNHEKNVFQSWSDPSRITYPFFFEPIKKDIEAYLKRGTTLIRKRLGIEKYTRSTEFHFDGAQNQGDDRLWFSIFNSSYKSQKTSFQLFFEILESRVRYGLVYMNDRSKDKITEELDLSLSKLITEFRKYIPIIQTDDYKIKELYIKMKELFELKPQIILQGPPGTGKTFSAKNIAYNLIFDEIISNDPISRKEQLKKLEETEQFKLIQFHPSYSYEDFVRGINATAVGEKIEYKTENKVLAEFAIKAKKNYSDHIRDKQIVVKENTFETLINKYIRSLDERYNKGRIYLNETGAYIKGFTTDYNAFIYYHDEYHRHEDGSDDGYGFNFSLDTFKQLLIESDGISDINSIVSKYTYHTKVIRELIFDFRNYSNSLTTTLQKDEFKLSNYVLIIDEINRANLSSVLGELIYGLEYRDEPVDSMYEFAGSKKIVLPPNLYIIGTMNTADRSVGHIDYAIRRRFAFVDVLPKPEPIKEFALHKFKQVSRLFIKNYECITNWENPVLERSELLAPDFRPEDVWIGHSYFIADNEEQLKIKLQYEVKPILKEYLKDGILLDGAKSVIDKIEWD